MCGLQPLVSTPSYGILGELQSYLRLSSPKPHKPLFPLSRGDIAGFILTILVLFIAAGGGIGGGGAIIPLYILFIGFDTRIAVALGNITIVGGALSNFVFNAPRRHAFLNRPLIDWDLILVMEPATILGAMIGGYLNKLFPGWLTTILLALLLTFISYKLVMRGIISWRAESAQQTAHEAEEDLTDPLLPDEPTTNAAPASSPRRARAIPSGRSPHREGEAHSPLAYTASLGRGNSFSFRRNEGDIRSRVAGGEDESDGEQARLDRLEEQSAEDAPPLEDVPRHANNNGHTETGLAPSTRSAVAQKTLEDDGGAFVEKRQVPPLRFGILFLLTAVVAASDYLKGIVSCGTWQYWLIVFAVIPVAILVTLGGRNYLLKKGKRRRAAGYIHVEGDVDWNPVTTLTYPAICSFAGLVAGMFGVGGGIIKGPLMLELGVLPDVASATSATMIVFTSASASIVFLSFGGIPTDYAITVFIIGIVFTMLGQIACFVLMKILARRSVIVFAMASLMLLSMVIVYYEAISGTIAAAHDHRLWNFGKLCS